MLRKPSGAFWGSRQWRMKSAEAFKVGWSGGATGRLELFDERLMGPDPTLVESAASTQRSGSNLCLWRLKVVVDVFIGILFRQ
jgi:hypothetical protein